MSQTGTATALEIIEKPETDVPTETAPPEPKIYRPNCPNGYCDGATGDSASYTEPLCNQDDPLGASW